jgi:hypothetical protein
MTAIISNGEKGCCECCMHRDYCDMTKDSLIKETKIVNGVIYVPHNCYILKGKQEFVFR